jgi:hypothetical protein
LDRLHEAPVRRIEDASQGLACIMRQYDCVFWEPYGSDYLIHVPKRTKSGKRDHRSYEKRLVEKAQVENADECLRHGNMPMRWALKAHPPTEKRPPKSLKAGGGKRLP